MTTELTQKFTPLTEAELTQVDGGAIPLIAWIVAHPYLSGSIAGGVTAIGTAIWGAFK